MIARNLDSKIYSSSNHKLITKDNIQKIIFENVFPEVPLLFQTQFSYLVDKYKKGYVQEKQAQIEFEKNLLEMLNWKISKIFCTLVYMYICPYFIIQWKKKVIRICKDWWMVM